MKGQVSFAPVGFLFFSTFFILFIATFLPSIVPDSVLNEADLTLPPSPEGFIDSIFYVASNIGLLFGLTSFSTSIALLNSFILVLSVVNIYIIMRLVRGGG